MRGKAYERWESFRTKGITPAHAGKSFENFLEVLQEKDHPRTCGEKKMQRQLAELKRGSPPHMRGKGPT